MIQANQFIELGNGIELHYASCGDPSKPLMLMIHGFPEFWYAWHELMPKFARDYFVVAPDMRGYNLSSKPEEVASYKPKYLVDDVTRLIRGLGKEKAVVLAHDWGGAIAWNLALGFPDIVERLIILNAPHPYLFAKALAGDPKQQASSQYMNWLRTPGSENLLMQDNFKKLEGFFNKPNHEPWCVGDVQKAYHAAWSMPNAVKSAVNWYRASPLYPPTRDDLGAMKLQLNPDDFIVRVPTLVIWGMEDTALPAGLIEGLASFIPNGEIVRLAKASHWLIHEFSEQIEREIKRYLNLNDD